jgi:uncharacterized protein (TIGR03067 family)
MARLLTAAVLVLAAGAAAAEDKKEQDKFQGTWKVVKAEFGGEAPPGGVPPEMRFVFDGDKVTVNEKKEKPESGSFTVDPKKDPAEIDLTSPKGEKILGIYKFDKDGKLTMCFTKGKDAARPKSFETKDTQSALIVLEKAKG